MLDRLEVEYVEGASLPDLWVTWRKASGALVDFVSEPHAFVMTVENRAVPGTLAFTKQSGIVGYDTDPNVSIAWTAGVEISALTPGVYDGVLAAPRAVDAKPRKMPFTITITRRSGATPDPGPLDPPT